MRPARLSVLLALLVTVGFPQVGSAVVASSSSSFLDARMPEGSGLPDDRLSADEQCRIGLNYLNGDGVAKDPLKGLSWLRRAAERGQPRAQSNLGVMYAEGLGVPRDEISAVVWIRKAALNGWAEGQLNLGLAYMNGMGVKPDPVEAIKWLKLAANQGNVLAEFNLGIAYVQGDGVARNLIEAQHWFTMAAEHGYPPAKEILEVTRNKSARSANNGTGRP